MTLGHESRLRLQSLFVACGALAWLGVVVPVAVNPLARVQAPPIWWVLVFVHQMLFLAAVSALGHPDERRLRWAAVAMLIVGPVASMIWAAGGLTPLLVVVNVTVMGFAFSMRWVLAALVAQTVWLSFLLPAQGLGLDWVISYIALMVFGLLMVEVALSESRARHLANETASALEASNQQLQQANAQLAQAQAKLARQEVDEERLRIARDLHDKIGHQLTALTLNLEVASHLVDGRAVGHVEQSRELAKTVLGDIRDVVSKTRESRVHASAELQRLALAFPDLEVDLAVTDRLDTAPRELAEAVVRIAQEAVANAAQHGRASRVWVSASADETGFRLTVRDDGQGLAGAMVPGNGLVGMRERLQALGGTVDWDSGPDGGFALTAHIPIERI